jgi:hypothetical protein
MNDIDSWTQIVGQVVKLANEIYDTPFVPDGLRGSAAAVSACILAGREMGLGPMTSLANIDVIRGKPTQKPLLMRAMIQSAGHKWEEVEVSDTRVVVRGCRKGESAWATATFTADQAKRAGLDLGKYPADKLYARASSRLARRKFADVIMGIPYTPEDVEDGIDGDEAGTLTEDAPAAIEAAKPRTAQRKARTQSPPPAAAAPPSAAAPSPSAQAAAGGDLPPLPGEEDAPGPVVPAPPEAGPGAPDQTDYDTPGTVTNRQLTAIWTSLSQTYHFGDDEKDQARMVCAQILSSKGKKVELASSKNLSHNQARTVLDTLAHWKAQAEQQDEEPRGYLMLMLQAAGDQDGTAGGE